MDNPPQSSYPLILWAEYLGVVGLKTKFHNFLNKILSTGDIIIKEGSIGTKMYFIQEGVVDIVMANGEVSLEIFPNNLSNETLNFRLQHLFPMDLTSVRFAC